MKIGDKIISFFMGLVSPSKRKTNKFMDDYVSKLRAIEMSDKGFVIVGFSEVKEVEIKWSSVNDVIYEKEKVTIKMNGQREMIIPLDFHINWYGLIRKVPKGYPSYDYNLVELFFANLTGCEICGLKGVNEEEQECIACNNEVWNSELEDLYESKEAYLKEMQLEHFKSSDDDGKIEIHNRPEDGFESYSLWKPLVVEEDYRDVDKH